jgi:hypothetical protein
VESDGEKCDGRCAAWREKALSEALIEAEDLQNNSRCFEIRACLPDE